MDPELAKLFQELHDAIDGLPGPSRAECARLRQELAALEWLALDKDRWSWCHKDARGPFEVTPGPELDRRYHPSWCELARAMGWTGEP
jgi:hypothetical protein